jgi:hypothetical protein
MADSSAVALAVYIIFQQLNPCAQIWRMVCQYDVIVSRRGSLGFSKALVSQIRAMESVVCLVFSWMDFREMAGSGRQILAKYVAVTACTQKLTDLPLS